MIKKATTKASPKEPIREWQIQSALVKWARLRGLLLISIPNAGKRSLHGGCREVTMGLMAGASDLFLAMPSRSGLIHGFWIELKIPGKVPTTSQQHFFEAVRSQGYHADWYDDWQKAAQAIEKYLNHM